jgi:hypothetical protein
MGRKHDFSLYYGNAGTIFTELVPEKQFFHVQIVIAKDDTTIKLCIEIPYKLIGMTPRTMFG